MRTGGREALSSFRAATRNPEVPARDYVNKSPTYSLWAPHHVRGDTVRIGGGEALSSFRAATRNPGAPARDYVNKSPACSLWTPHRVRVTRLCSFFSAARRTNQEAPPLLSGYLARRLAPPSGAAELAALKQSSPLFLNRLASSRPDKGGGIATLHRKCPGHFAVRYPKIYRPISSFRATTRNPEIPGHGITQYSRTVWHYSTLCHLQSWAPLRMWGDTVRIGGGEALSSFRATTRNPEIPGHGITQDARAMRHYSTLCHPEAGPRVECGVTQCASRVG